MKGSLTILDDDASVLSVDEALTKEEVEALRAEVEGWTKDGHHVLVLSGITELYVTDLRSRDFS